ncbi:NXPE family member 4-like [Pelodytes ibericus]
MPGREARDNTVKIFNLIHHAQILQKPTVFLSIDLEKAFDRLYQFIIPVKKHPTEDVSQLQLQVNEIFDQINQMFPEVNLTHKDNTTCAQNSRATIVNPRDKYCVGDILIVRVDMYDYLKKKKNYGGDYLRARISTPGLEAAASGRFEDFKNGTYHIHFLLSWEGEIVVSISLIHPSEGVSAIWNARNRWYGYIKYTGIFIKENQQIETNCGFELDNSKELCEYSDHRNEEYFYCVKPSNYSCHSFTQTRSIHTQLSNLTKNEQRLFEKSNIGVKIPNDFGNITVVNCSSNSDSQNRALMPRCKIGMKLQYPSGHFMNNTWYPHSCSMQIYRSMEQLNSCMKGKFIYLFGDSTLRQWFYYFTSKLKTLKMFNLYESGWACPRLGIDLQRNIMVSWKRHTSPFISGSYQSYKEERTISEELDLIGGNQHTVIVLNIGVHFRAHPLHHFIRRLSNIRSALERLFLRSPQTKVIIKTENSGDPQREYETCGDFHGYVQYLIVEHLLKDLEVGFVNGWDMTIAFDANKLHPPASYIQNEVDMLMTYICQ